MVGKITITKKKVLLEDEIEAVGKRVVKRIGNGAFQETYREKVRK